MDQILRRLDEINAALEVPSDHFRGELLAERDLLIDQLGGFYRTATPRQRGAIRRFVRGSRRLIMAFEDRVTWHAYRIRTVEDISHLHLGLAAASVIGEGIDARDFGFAADHLARAAARAGIDARPHFQEAAAYSGKRRSFLRHWSQHRWRGGGVPDQCSLILAHDFSTIGEADSPARDDCGMWNGWIRVDPDGRAREDAGTWNG